MDIEAVMARYILDTTFDDLPQDAVSATKEHLLHTMGTMLGGSAASGCNMVAELVWEWGGVKQSSVCVYGGKVPVHHAALANCTMAHALDFCNNDDRIAYKSSVCAVPVGLAICEARGNVSGKELIAALCLGIDLGLRVGLSAMPQYAHVTASRLGAFVSTAIAGKLLGLNQKEMLNAFGLAYCQFVTMGTGIGAPSLNKRLGPGLVAQAGVFSAQLAKKGYPSGSRVFDGPAGYFKVYHGQEGDIATLTGDLGKRFEITRVGPKPYPSCRFTHASIDATLELVKRNNIHSAEVQEVRVYLCPRDYQSVGGGNSLDELEAKQKPRGVTDAQFSVPWTVATAIVKRDVFIPAFTEKGILDRETLAMAKKVTPVILPELEKGACAIKPAIVEIRTKAGKVYSEQVDFPSGSPEKPFPYERIQQNFRRAAALAALPFSSAQVEEIIKAVNQVEELDNAGAIAALLVPGKNQ